MFSLAFARPTTWRQVVERLRLSSEEAYFIMQKQLLGALFLCYFSGLCWAEPLAPQIIAIDKAIQLATEAAKVQPNEPSTGLTGWEFSRQNGGSSCTLQSDGSFLGDINISWQKSSPGEVQLTHLGRFEANSKVTFSTGKSVSFLIEDPETGNMPISRLSITDFQALDDVLRSGDVVKIDYGQNVKSADLRGYKPEVKKFMNCISGNLDQPVNDATTPNLNISPLELNSKPTFLSLSGISLGYWRVQTLIDKHQSFPACLMLSEQDGYNFRFWLVKGSGIIVGLTLSADILEGIVQGGYDKFSIETSSGRRYGFDIGEIADSAVIASVPLRDIGPLFQAIARSRTIYAGVGYQDNHDQPQYVELETDNLQLIFQDFGDCIRLIEAN